MNPDVLENLGISNIQNKKVYEAILKEFSSRVPPYIRKTNVTMNSSTGAGGATIIVRKELPVYDDKKLFHT